GQRRTRHGVDRGCPLVPIVDAMQRLRIGLRPLVGWKARALLEGRRVSLLDGASLPHIVGRRGCCRGVVDHCRLLSALATWSATGDVSRPLASISTLRFSARPAGVALSA